MTGLYRPHTAMLSKISGFAKRHLQIVSIVTTGVNLQVKTFLSGRIAGLDAGSKIYVSITALYKKNDSLTVVNNSFPFKLNVEEGDIYFLNYSIHSQTFGEAVLSLKGNNYILPDIWASRCVPYRKSTPAICRLLSTYRQRNFKVIGVAADTNGKLWKETIAKDTMNRQHLSDLRGTDAGFMRENHIFAYPPMY